VLDEASGLVRQVVDVTDEEGTDLLQHFRSCNAFIRGALESSSARGEGQGGGEARVLVHCWAGQSRSAAVRRPLRPFWRPFD
jgi:protein-tyrosine phosphatase